MSDEEIVVTAATRANVLTATGRALEQIGSLMLELAANEALLEKIDKTQSNLEVSLAKSVENAARAVILGKETILTDDINTQKYLPILTGTILLKHITSNLPD